MKQGGMVSGKIDLNPFMLTNDTDGLIHYVSPSAGPETLFLAQFPRVLPSTFAAGLVYKIPQKLLNIIFTSIHGFLI